MLIRSQDKKTLVNLDNVARTEIESINEDTYNINAGYNLIGTYSSEEKAIKVLDMIQEEYLKCNCQPIMGNYGFVKNSIFQMPQDSEV